MKIPKKLTKHKSLVAKTIIENRKNDESQI